MAGAVLVGMLAACGGGNPAAGMNAALERFIEAQGQFTQTEASLSPSAVNQAWLDERAALLTSARSSFTALKTAAEDVHFREQAQGPGERAQAAAMQLRSEASHG